MILSSGLYFPGRPEPGPPPTTVSPGVQRCPDAVDEYISGAGYRDERSFTPREEYEMKLKCAVRQSWRPQGNSPY